jgi:UDP-N-acetylmuramate--alanine ligase
MNDTAVRDIPQRVHLVGVGGIHMSGIARILRARGHDVTGSDLYRSPVTAAVESLGVTVHEGHAAENIDEAQLLVYTSAAHDDNAEIAEARRRGIPTIKRGEMVARLAEGKQVIAIAGTHGKTTTSSLIAFILQRAGLSPTFMAGGMMVDLATSAEPGEGPHFVVEADEYDAAFLNYRPHIALVTNIEPDHIDFYGSFEELQQTFRQFLTQVENNGYIVACLDSPALQACLHPLQAGPSPGRALLPTTVGGDVTNPVHVVSYGLISREADWTAENISQKGIDTSTFMVKFQNKVWGALETHLPGVHNVSNVLGAVAVAEIIGVPRETIAEAVADFHGVRRRFELIGEAPGGITIMDDYAHHPTEVRATLAAARDRFAGRRLVALFQPHTYTRTAYLLEGFRTCFEGCDVLLIADTYAAREQPSAGMDARQLADEIEAPPAGYVGNLEQAAEAAAAVLQPGDVFFTIGAGDVEKVGPMVLELLSK